MMNGIPNFKSLLVFQFAKTDLVQNKSRHLYLQM